MKAQFIGCTLVVTPETEHDKEQLQYYGAKSDSTSLWECFGWQEDEGSFSVQGLCPVGLQDWEILNHLRFMMELAEKPYPTEETALRLRFTEDTAIMDKIRNLIDGD